MDYIIDLSEQAQKDIVFHKTSGNKVLLKKLFVLLYELTQHPFEGTGKPEALKHDWSGYYSRRTSIASFIGWRVML